VRAAGVSTVQLVDEVRPGAYAALRRDAPGVKIVQVLHVQDEDVVEQARRVEREVDAILLDSGVPGARVKELGGTGRTHDWSLSARVVATTARPVFLAGGIRPSNVAEAIRTVRPFGIDLCSGVRTDGRLDEMKLRALVHKMQVADMGE
jgi:phosphoribosylanthranilate isomerase